jgi:hypothetical protein
VKAADGGPSFSGGSRFVIGVEGASLLVGLATIPADKAVARGSSDTILN